MSNRNCLFETLRRHQSSLTPNPIPNSNPSPPVDVNSPSAVSHVNTLRLRSTKCRCERCSAHDKTQLITHTVLSGSSFWISCDTIIMNLYLWIWAAVIAAVAALYCTSNKARYYFKFIYFILVSLLGATLPIPLMLLKPRDSDNALIPAWVLRVLSKLMGLKFTVRGKENIVKGSGCVVLINHQSALDLIVLAELWPIMDRCTVISKKEVFYLGPFGLATWLWGTIFIDRLNPEKAQNAINTTGATIRNRKARVLMFPEGTRHGGLELLPFKKGAFHLAIASKCPIQPVVVSNYYFLDDKTYKFEEGESVITILPPINTDGLSKEDLPALMEKTRNDMAASYKELSNEVNTKIKNKNNNISKTKIN